MINSILNINNNNDFEKIAIDIFKYQAKNNKVYKNYLQHLDINSDKVKKINDIIYLPIYPELPLSKVEQVANLVNKVS